MKNYLPEFKDYLDEKLLSDKRIEPGLMFGCPGYYVSGKLAICHYNDNLFIKLDPKKAEDLITADKNAHAEGPFGNRRMGKSWVFLHLDSLADLERRMPLIHEAVDFVDRTVKTTKK